MSWLLSVIIEDHSFSLCNALMDNVEATLIREAFFYDRRHFFLSCHSKTICKCSSTISSLTQSNISIIFTWINEFTFILITEEQHIKIVLFLRGTTLWSLVELMAIQGRLCFVLFFKWKLVILITCIDWSSKI